MTTVYKPSLSLANILKVILDTSFAIRKPIKTVALSDTGEFVDRDKKIK